MTPHFPLRRAPKRFLEGAPDYVLDVFDNRGKTMDRYTVIFGEQFAYLESDGRTCRIALLNMSEDQSPRGICLWEVLPVRDIRAFRKRERRYRTRWLDLPERIRQRVIGDGEAPF